MNPRYHVNPYDAAIAGICVAVLILSAIATTWAWLIELDYV